MTPTEDTSPDFNDWPSAALIVLAGLLASGLVLLGTKWGPWAYSDGVGYIVSARNLVDGIGLGLILPSGQFEPLISHPPLYPILLAAFSQLNMSLLEAARWIDVLSGFGFVVAVSGILLWITQSRWFAISIAFTLALTPPLLLMFISAMAEPLSLALSIPGLLLLIRFRFSGSRIVLLLAGLLSALAILTRYPNVSLAAAGAAYIAISQGSRKIRIKNVSIFSIVSLAPAGLFILWSRLVRTAELPRALVSVEGSKASAISFLKELAQTIWRWKPIPSSAVVDGLFGSGQAAILPIILSAVLAIAILLLLVTKVGLQFNRIRSPLARIQGAGELIILSSIYVTAYIVLLALSYFGTYPTPDIDFRTVLPIMPGLLIVAILALELLRSGEPVNLIGNTSFVIAIAAILAGYSTTTVDLISGHFRTGAGYTGKSWQNSATMEFISSIDDEKTLVSNAPEAVLLYHNRYPHDYSTLQAKDQVSGSECPEWAQSIISKRGGLIVLFEISGDPSESLASISDDTETLIAACGLETAARLEDGVVLSGS